MGTGKEYYVESVDDGYSVKAAGRKTRQRDLADAERSYRKG